MYRLRLQKYFYCIMLRILGWRPIATAPTDGTTVIILEEHGFEYWNTFQAQYIDEQPFPGWIGLYIAKYVGADDDHVRYVDKPIVTRPDFWRPLPKAPKIFTWWALTCNDIEVKK